MQGNVACCPLVSHDKYVDKTDRHTDRQDKRQTVTLHFLLDVGRGQRNQAIVDYRLFPVPSLLPKYAKQRGVPCRTRWKFVTTCCSMAFTLILPTPLDIQSIMCKHDVIHKTTSSTYGIAHGLATVFRWLQHYYRCWWNDTGYYIIYFINCQHNKLYFFRACC